MVSAIRIQDAEDKDLLQKQLQDSTVGLVLNAILRGTKTIRPVYQE